MSVRLNMDAHTQQELRVGLVAPCSPSPRPENGTTVVGARFARVPQGEGDVVPVAEVGCGFRLAKVIVPKLRWEIVGFQLKSNTVPLGLTRCCRRGRRHSVRV